MTFGLQIDEAAAGSVLDRAAEGGVTFIDTADVYPLGGGSDLAGTTEDILGRWLKGKRHQFVLATKCYGRTGPQAWDVGNSRRHILDAVDASLRRLGTDYIDLYQLHGDDPETPLEETLQALDDLVRSGKVRYIGCWNFPAYRVARALGRREALEIAKASGLEPATLAVAWVMHNPAVTSPIIGASRPDQLEDTLAAAEVKLEAGVLSQLDELTRDFRRGDASR